VKERDYDVIVYGAGPEGVTAALAAAERSQRTLLVDGGPDVGGASVCGLLNCWHGEADAPLMELVRALSKRAWGKLIFEPDELAQALRGRLQAAGVELMLNAEIAKVKVKGDRIRSLSLAAGNGRVKLSAWCYVDASQDFAMARLAECEFTGEESKSAISLLARIGGIDTRVSGVFDAEVLRQYVGQFKSEQAIEEIPTQLSYPALVPCLRGGTAMLNAAGEGICVEAGVLGLTSACGRCRDSVYATIGFLQRNVPGYENCFLIHYANRPLIMACPKPLRLREESVAEASDSDAIEDIVVMSFKDMDRPDVSMAVPLGNLMCRGADNMLLARAGIMAPDQIPLLLGCGDAVGRVAAQAVLYDGNIAKLDIDRLKKALFIESPD
jgi:hypothetical protein